MSALLAGIFTCVLWVAVAVSVVLVHTCQLVCLVRELPTWWRRSERFMPLASAEPVADSLKEGVTPTNERKVS